MTKTWLEDVSGKKDDRDKTKVIIVRKNNHFINEGGSWTEAEAKAKELKTYGKVIEGLIDDLAKAVFKFNEVALDAYNSAPKTDCLFYDSPLSPSRVVVDLKCYVKKAGLPIVRDVIAPSISIKQFSDSVVDYCKWLLKFKNEKVN